MKAIIATIGGREITLDESTTESFLKCIDKDGKLTKAAFVINDNITGKTKTILYRHCIEQIDIKY
jgi:hypothetical protein